jgi:hypothetical protein
MRSLYWLLRLSAPTFEPRLTVAARSVNTGEEILPPIRPGAFAAWIREREAADRAAAASSAAAPAAGVRGAGARSLLGERS